MSVTLSATLIAHQKGSPRVPKLFAQAQARRHGSLIFRWSRWYTGAEADQPIAACIADDGSLVRARNDAGTIRTSRVAPPVTSSSTFSAWNSTDVQGFSGSSLGLAARSGELILAYIRLIAGVYHVTIRTSADDGATWSAVTSLTSSAVVKNAATVAIRQSNGDACVFYREGAAVFRVRRTAGVWGAPVATTLAAPASLTGIAASHSGADYVVVVTGTEAVTTHKRAWVTLFGDGGIPSNTWAAYVNIDESDTLSTLTFQIGGNGLMHDLADVYGTWSRKEAAAVILNRAFEARPPSGLANNSTWSEPAPTGVTGSASGPAYACYPAATLTRVYLVTPSGVWAADCGQQTDLSARVQVAAVTLGLERSHVALALDTADGAMNTEAQRQALGLYSGATIQVKPGYSVPAVGDEFGAIWRFVIDSVAVAWTAKGRVVLVSAEGAFEALKRFQQPQTWQTAAALLSRAQLVQRAAARAGLASLNAGAPRAPSANFTAHQPSFVWPIASSAWSAVQRLLEPLGDGLRDSGEAVTVVGNLAADAAEHAYGGSGEYLVQEATIAESRPEWNWTQLNNPTVRYSNQIDEASVYQHGAIRRTLRSLDASSDTRANDYGRDNVRRATWMETRGEIVGPVNAGLQLLDIVALTNTPLGLTSEKFRVIGIELRYNRTHYTHTLTLGGM